MEYQIMYCLGIDLDWVWFENKTFDDFESALNQAHLMYKKEPLELRIINESGKDVVTFHITDGEKFDLKLS